MCVWIDGRHASGRVSLFTKQTTTTTTMIELTLRCTTTNALHRLVFTLYTTATLMMMMMMMMYIQQQAERERERERREEE